MVEPGFVWVQPQRPTLPTLTKEMVFLHLLTKVSYYAHLPCFVNLICMQCLIAHCALTEYIYLMHPGLIY